MRIGILGAGAIGCYVGGRLAAAGHTVTLVTRPALADELGRAGLRLTDSDGGDLRIAPGADRMPRAATAPAALASAETVLVTVKSQDTAAAAADLARVGGTGLVVSLQNGVRNPQVLAGALPGRQVLAGMVPYNVLRKPEAHFHRGTSGHLVVERSREGRERALVDALNGAGLACETRPDVAAVQWGKLLFNINNSVNALSGLPLQRQVGDRAYRRIMAAVMGEALGVMKRGGIRAAPPVKIPPALFPYLLRLPDAVFRRLAGTMLKIDPEARSSMWEDLDRRRRTEIDYLNGEIVRLAAEVGGAAPLNARIVELVRGAERDGKGSPGLSAAELGAALMISKNH